MSQGGWPVTTGVCSGRDGSVSHSSLQLADVPHASLRHLLIRLGVSRTSYANSTSASAHGAGIRPHSPPDTAVTPLTNPHARQQPFSLSLSLEIRLPSARTSQEAERNPRSSHTSPSRPRHGTEQRAHAAEAHPLRSCCLQTPAGDRDGAAACWGHAETTPRVGPAPPRPHSGTESTPAP